VVGAEDNQRHDQRRKHQHEEALAECRGGFQNVFQEVRGSGVDGVRRHTDAAQTVALTLDMPLLGEIPEDAEIYRALLHHHKP